MTTEQRMACLVVEFISPHICYYVWWLEKKQHEVDIYGFTELFYDPNSWKKTNRMIVILKILSNFRCGMGKVITEGIGRINRFLPILH